MVIYGFYKNDIFYSENTLNTKIELKEEAIQEPTQNKYEFYNKNLKKSASLTPKNAYAIVVGIADYPGSGSDLSYTDDDAIEVYSLLTNDFNFKPENIIYLQDSNAGKSEISNAFDQIASQISEDDIFFFYYAGHGGFGTKVGPYSWTAETPHPYSNNYDNIWSVSHTGAAYMRVHFYRFVSEYGYDGALCGDSSVASGYYYDIYSGNYGYNFWSAYIPVNRYYIRFISDYIYSDYYGFKIDKYEAILDDGTHYLCSYDSIPDNPDNYYLDTLLDSKLDTLNCSKKYVIMDSCHSGGMIPEVQDIGRYIMTACDHDESSLESTALHNGVFSYYFLNSLDNATDTNGDGVISMEECFSYTYSNTVSYSGSLGYTHHPQEYDGITGESVLYPSFGSVSFNLSGNELSYFFKMYGNGLIEQLSIGLCCVSQSVIYKMEDLTVNASSTTGFGEYSGNIQLEGVMNITGYGISAEIRGNNLIKLNNTLFYDTDSDTLDDMFEIMHGLNPISSDSDSDGLNDNIEYYGVSDPLLPDTDFDGLLDGLEVNTYGTNVTNPDTDGDGIYDGYEIDNDLNPFFNDGHLDKDSDGLNNLLEYQLGSSANNVDSDDDQMPDYWEYNNNLNLTFDDAELDADYDDLNNINEYIYGTDPQNYDTDGDFYSDGIEVSWGTDPLNPFYSLNSIFLNIAGIAILFILGYHTYSKIIKKKRISAEKEKLDGKFKINKNSINYNALKVETKFKPVVTTTPYERMPSYGIPSNLELNKMRIVVRDFIQNKIPPPKPSYSVDGKRAMQIAMASLKFISEGRLNESFKSMILALQLGVPEPTNSLIKSTILNLLDQNINNSTLASLNEMNSLKKCIWCGALNKSTNTYCTKCGKVL